MAQTRSGRFLSVEIDGPASFRRAVAKADGDLARGVTRSLRDTANAVRDDARARYRGAYVQRSGRSVLGIRSRVFLGGAAVQLHRSRPHLTPQEWGGIPTTRDSLGRRFGGRYNPGGRASRRGGTGGEGTGTFLWPARARGNELIAATWQDQIQRVADDLSGRLDG